VIADLGLGTTTPVVTLVVLDEPAKACSNATALSAGPVADKDALPVWASPTAHCPLFVAATSASAPFRKATDVDEFAVTVTAETVGALPTGGCAAREEGPVP